MSSDWGERIEMKRRKDGRMGGQGSAACKGRVCLYPLALFSSQLYKYLYKIKIIGIKPLLSLDLILATTGNHEKYLDIFRYTGNVCPPGIHKLKFKAYTFESQETARTQLDQAPLTISGRSCPSSQRRSNEASMGSGGQRMHDQSDEKSAGKSNNNRGLIAAKFSPN